MNTQLLIWNNVDASDVSLPFATLIGHLADE